MSDWNYHSLGELVEHGRSITYGIVQPGPDVSPEGIPLIRGKDYSSGNVSIDGLYHVTAEVDEPYRRSKVKGGDILLSIAGYVGKTAVVPTELTGANLTQTTARLSIDKMKASSNFVYFALNSEEFGSEIKKYEKGSAQSGLNLGDVEKFRVYIPDDKVTQKKIANILTTVDNLIEKTQSLIDKYTAIKQGMMTDLFTRGIDLSGTPETNPNYGQLRPSCEQAPELYKETELGWVPKNWKVGVLGNIAEFWSGYAFKNHELTEYGMKAVRITNLHRPDFPYWRFDGEYKPTWVVEDGDLLFSWAGVASSIDAYIFKGERALLNQHIYNFRINDSFLKPHTYNYLKYFLPKLREEIEGGAGQLHLTKGKIQGIKIPIAEREELKKIVRVSKSLDSKIGTEKSYVKKLFLIKRGLMQDLLSGKVRVQI